MSKIHFDASKPGDVLATAYCGWLGGQTTEDEIRVTCRSCRARRIAKAEPAPVRTTKPQETKESALDRTIRTLLKPKADAPPRLTTKEFEGDERTVWEASCKGAEHRRCGDCAICLWEREAAKWEHAAPDRFEDERIKPEPSAVRPRWGSLAAALIALVEFERHNRFAPSAMGGLLARIERGSQGDGGQSRPDDPLLYKAGELVVLRSALERAYPDGGHPLLNAATCRAILVIRTPGVLIKLPTYEELATEHKVSEGVLRALVRHGRAAVTLELFDRGLIPKPRIGAHRARGEGSRCLAVQTTTT